MGNTQSGYTLTRTAATLDSFISELGPEIVYGERYAFRPFGAQTHLMMLV
jgi:hypothetical protein